MSRPGPASLDPASVKLAWPLAARLGEGPVWIAWERALWFVDIEGRALHRFDPDSGDGQSFAMPGRPSFVVPVADHSLVIGMELELHRVRDGALGAPLIAIGGDRNCRTNDATVDPRGRLWFGTMDLGHAVPTGQVHVYDGHALHPAGGHCPITNGPAVNAAGTRLYHVDTLAGVVWAFDISQRDTLVDGRIFATIDPADGKPDGVTIDSQDCLWVALWGGWCVRRYSPDGELLLSVPIPCAQVTKLAFGGDALRTAFVTTARARTVGGAIARATGGRRTVRLPGAGGGLARARPGDAMSAPYAIVGDWGSSRMRLFQVIAGTVVGADRRPRHRPARSPRLPTRCCARWRPGARNASRRTRAVRHGRRAQRPGRSALRGLPGRRRPHGRARPG